MDDRTRNKEAEFGRQASTFMKKVMAAEGKGPKDPIFPIIKPGSPEWEAWDRYFRGHLGFHPYAMQRVLSGQQQSMTVPAQWPEWFDPSFSSVQARRA